MTLILDDDDEVPAQAPAQAPVQQRRPRTPKPAPAGTNGHIDEGYLIGCFLLDEGATLDRAIQAGLLSTDLHDRLPAQTYGALRRMRENGIPIGLDTLVQEVGTQDLQQLLDWSDPIKLGTTARAGYYIERILSERRRQQAITETRKKLEALERGEDIPEPQQPLPQLRGLMTYRVLPRKDHSVLLGNRYLNRGDGGVLVSTSGMGKSALCLQGATELSLNRPAFGIQPNGPLRSLIIQAEDSDGDIGEVAHSTAHYLKLQPHELELVNERVRVVTDRTNRGLRFLGQLKKLVEQFKPDLVWINPLQAFIDGDVTDSQDLGRFLREGLNAINEPASFAYILVHHTTKPATGKDRTDRLWHEVMYDMAGGAEIINWARAVLSLRATETEGNFNLVLAKRGRRAGVTREVPQGAGFRNEIVTTIPLKHSSERVYVEELQDTIPMIAWEPRDPDAKPERKEGSGRKEKYSFRDYQNLFPSHTSQGLGLNELHRVLQTNKPIQKQTLHNCLQRWAEDHEVEVINTPGQPMRYRAFI